MTVLATAGHVDHGKSTFVNFLTGQETDRLKEEKIRGLTINLGYTYFEFKNRKISIVDVPGHVDYFKNTIAGFTNVDGIIFCIDSLQGWSKQSEEHFQAIRNLKINNIFFVLTKTDLLDSPVDKHIIEKKLKSEKLINYIIEEFSYKTSNLKLFQEKVAGFFKSDSFENPNSLWIDRSFTKDGIGKVITGTASKAFDLENIYLARTNKLLEVKEIRNTDTKVKNIRSTSRIAISLKKSTQDDISRGDLLTNDIVFSGKYIFAILNESDFRFDKKGSNRLFIGTTNQMIKRLEIVNASEKNLIFIELTNKVALLENQKILIQNMVSDDFIGGKIAFVSNNNNLVKNFFKQVRKTESIDVEQAFTLVSENLTESSKDYINISNKYISVDYLKSITKKIKENIKTINSVGVKNYFYDELFIEDNYLDELINKIDELNVINNQLFVDKKIDVDLEVYKNVIKEISNDLSVKYVDINKFNKESIRELFMSEYLYRIDKNIIIGKEHKSQLVEILQKLPDIFDVSEFKEASNLSRKFAIPYLEFLDKCLYTSKIDGSGKRKKLV